MTTNWIFSGRKSSGAAALGKIFKRMKTGKLCKPGDTVVNWGSTTGPPMSNNILNKPEFVLLSANKLNTFAVLSGKHIVTVPWTASMDIAKEWLADGAILVARKILTGHSGAGIIIIEKPDQFIEAPLYTKYIRKVREFRVHVTTAGVIDTQIKVRDPAREPVTWKVRSHKNGFIFQRKNIQPSPERDALAMATLQALGLDFGAIDIIEDKSGNFYVLECNTAPGLEGSSIEIYTEALKQLTGQ